MRAIRDRIIVRREKEPEKTKSGFFIPETNREKPQRGLVVTVGEKVKEIQVDNIVLFGKYAGTEVEIDGEQFLILRDEEILAVL